MSCGRACGVSIPAPSLADGLDDLGRGHTLSGAFDMVGACLESGVCTNFTVWGVSDANSVITCTDSWCGGAPDADPLLFDRDFRPKPAYCAVREALAK